MGEAIQTVCAVWEVSRLWVFPAPGGGASFIVTLYATPGFSICQKSVGGFGLTQSRYREKPPTKVRGLPERSMGFFLKKSRIELMIKPRF